MSVETAGSQQPANPYGPDEARAEHRACVDYHTSLVNTRFTIAGLYVAAMGFVAGAVFKSDAHWDLRAGASFLACWLSLCLWILELRSRALFTNIAHRGVEIERQVWGFTGERAMAGFFSRQHKLPEKDAFAASGPEPRRMTPDRPSLGTGHRVSERLSRYISHSMGLDMLFAGGLLFWSLSTLISTVYWL
jgi:hypothetical protein